MLFGHPYHHINIHLLHYSLTQPKFYSKSIYMSSIIVNFRVRKINVSLIIWMKTDFLAYYEYNNYVTVTHIVVLFELKSITIM